MFIEQLVPLEGRGSAAIFVQRLALLWVQVGGGRRLALMSLVPFPFHIPSPLSPMIQVQVWGGRPGGFDGPDYM